MPKQDKNLTRNPRDHGSNYNVFGYNPDGRVAYLVALFYGSAWRPQTTPKQFGGPPAPLRFGPPAPYQKCCLPDGFKPTMHHDYNKMVAAFAANEKAKIAGEEMDDLDPPDEFDPHIFDAFKFRREFMEREVEDEETSIKGDDSVIGDDPMKCEDQEEETTLAEEHREVDGAGEKSPGSKESIEEL